MKCPECGSNINDNDKFCNSCGAEIPAQESQGRAAEDDVASPETDPVPEKPPNETEPVPEAAEAAPQPSEPDAPPPPPSPPPITKVKGRTNTGLIIGLVVLLVLLACCCCAIAGGIVFFEPFSDAINNAVMGW